MKYTYIYTHTYTYIYIYIYIYTYTYILIYICEIMIHTLEKHSYMSTYIHKIQTDIYIYTNLDKNPYKPSHIHIVIHSILCETYTRLHNSYKHIFIEK